MLARNLKVVVLGLAVLIVALAPAVTAAQDKSDLSKIDRDSKKWAEQATQAVRERRYEDAVKGFLMVFEISREPSSLYNVAMIYLLRLGDTQKAWEYAMQYADLAKTEKDRRDAARLVARLEFDLQKSKVRLSILVTPTRAKLWLNEKTERGRLKRKTAWVSPGTHKVFAQSPNHDPVSVEVRAEMGKSAQAKLILDPHEAILRVVSKVPDSQVFLNGKPAGTAPTESEIPPGPYTVRVEAKGFKPFTKKIRVDPGKALVMPVKLEVLPEPVVPVSDVTLAEGAMGPMEIGAWTSIGTGGALAIAGAAVLIKGYLNVKSFPKVSDYPGAYQEYQDAYDSARSGVKTYEAAGWACLGVGVAAVGVGIVLYYTGDSDGSTAVVPTWLDGNPGLAASVQF